MYAFYLKFNYKTIISYSNGSAKKPWQKTSYTAREDINYPKTAAILLLLKEEKSSYRFISWLIAVAHTNYRLISPHHTHSNTLKALSMTVVEQQFDQIDLSFRINIKLILKEALVRLV